LMTEQFEETMRRQIVVLQRVHLAMAVTKHKVPLPVRAGSKH
jgi:hypothetical protein